MAAAPWELVVLGGNGTLSNNNLTFAKTVGVGAWNCNVRGSVAFTEGVHEWMVSAVGTHVMIGVAPANLLPNGSNYLTCGWYNYCYLSTGANGKAIHCQPHNGAAALSSAVYAGIPGVPLTSEFMVRLDCDAHTLTFGANGTWWPVAYTNLPAVPLYPSFDVHTGPYFTVTHMPDDAVEADALLPEQVYRDQILAWQVAPPPVCLRVHVDQARLLVLGDAGVGKSSFWNTLSSGVRNRPYAPVRPSPQAEHGTRQLQRVPILGPDNHEIRAAGFDCWGWTPNYTAQIQYLVAGRVAENAPWDTVPHMNQGPAILFRNEMHGVLLMISYTGRQDIDHARQIIDLCRPSQVPVNVLLTKCDMAEGVKSDLTNFFECRQLQVAQQQLARDLGIDSEHIHLVTAKNRSNSPKLADGVKSRAMAICMKAFMDCLYSTSDFVEYVNNVAGVRGNFE
eukprot:CAMPEP_0201523658 /NCGR_PEP_ID=MMETSP0161_2-20130828/20698_1 /ASSEMBLY_ACC=CAM_ASM_000251 /TAXON_ID=180227 /ORGANISM="Neoparamoeba aestuarina, Strain SoJaBio B1-5/56/2" /LENGTH=449 /DNA_ID=CAMNT_0047922843 /DNA_START=105 /DNA_END=1454 /DNA_ORIENTATION=+